jgi:branched-chain amino acid transport system permease protein
MKTRAGVIGRLVILALFAFLVVAPYGLKPYGIYILRLWAVMTIAAMGLNITLGYAGQVSLAQGSFVGIGAYTTAILTTHGYPFGLAIAVSILLCFAVGWLLGYPALRVQHHYLAFVTLAFSTLCFLVFRNEEWLTGGIYGISGIPRPSFFGVPASSPRAYYYVCLAGLALVSLASWGLIRSPWGRAFRALRENAMRALSLGVDTRLYTLMAFAIGSTLGGVAGTLYAPLVQYIDPSPFALSLSLNLLLMVVVGGSSSFFGPYLGALIAVLLPEWLRFTEGLYLIVYGALVVVLMVFCPSGLLGLAGRLLHRTSAAADPAAEAPR